MLVREHTLIDGHAWLLWANWKIVVSSVGGFCCHKHLLMAAIILIEFGSLSVGGS